MSRQPYITSHMMNVLVDWLVKVGRVYSLKNDTLHLGIYYMKRFLSYMSIEKKRFQLLGTTCLYVASKYEEIYPPKVDEFVYINDGTCSKLDIVNMEIIVLGILGFDLSIPTCSNFLQHFVSVSDVDVQVDFLALYLSDLSLNAMEDMHKFKPSIVAAASLALARCTLGRTPWSDVLILYSGIKMKDLYSCFESLHRLHVESLSSMLDEVKVLYSSRKYMNVASVKPLVVLPELYNL